MKGSSKISYKDEDLKLARFANRIFCMRCVEFDLVFLVHVYAS
jgi:hypothetical protein